MIVCGSFGCIAIDLDTLKGSVMSGPLKRVPISDKFGTKLTEKK